MRLLFALFILYSGSASAQCNLHKKADEFTGKTTWWTDKVKITDGGTSSLFKSYGENCRYKTYISFILQDGRYFLSVSEDADECSCTVERLSLKFADGSVMIKKKYKDGTIVKTTLGEETNAFFELTSEEMKKLATTMVTRFKIEDSYCPDHPVLNEEMEERFAKKIMGDAYCMVSEANR